MEETGRFRTSLRTRKKGRRCVLNKYESRWYVLHSIIPRKKFTALLTVTIYMHILGIVHYFLKLIIIIIVQYYTMMMCAKMRAHLFVTMF